MLSRFFRYIDKVFDFGEAVAKLKDSRGKPQIATMAIWLSAFVMFATRRRSLNAIEVDLRAPKRLDDLMGPRKGLRQNKCCNLGMVCVYFQHDDRNCDPAEIPSPCPASR